MWSVAEVPNAYHDGLHHRLRRTKPALMLQVIPLDAVGFHEAFNIRVDELQVLSMEFLYDCSRPTVALLYQDNKDVRHLRTYEMSLKDKVRSSSCELRTLNVMQIVMASQTFMSLFNNVKMPYTGDSKRFML